MRKIDGSRQLPNAHGRLLLRSTAQFQRWVNCLISPDMDMTRIMLVGMGGFLGSIARYVVVKTVDARLHQLFPFGTLMVNVVGCFMIGIVAGIAGRQFGGGENLRAFLGAGFCGGFTTFSAFALENHNLFSDRFAGVAVLYVACSVIAGIGAVFLGLWCARFL